MTDPRNLSIKDFFYSLPEERIARYPLPERDDSKLLIFQNKIIREDVFKNIISYLPSNSLLLFNDTKVIEARLLFKKETGGFIEIFCLEPHEQYADITTAMLQKEKVYWKCLVGGASKWKHGQLLEKKLISEGNEFRLEARYIEKAADSFTIELSWNNNILSFADVLHLAGAIPLPPYIKRAAEKSDAERYQTIYAHHDGSVAAPTAGLHFANHVFSKMMEKNIQKDFITLHVGAGTFKPVKSQLMANHEMHAETFTVSKTTIENIYKQLEKDIISVGTTSLRTIESLYWLAVNIMRKGESFNAGITQWEVYDTHQSITAQQALSTLLEWMNEKKINSVSAKTQIIIAPGYQFKIVQGLITNFHQPQSTLLLLVSAFIGNDWRKVYDYALKKDFRFLSYGDGCLLWRSQD